MKKFIEKIFGINTENKLTQTAPFEIQISKALWNFTREFFGWATVATLPLSFAVMYKFADWGWYGIFAVTVYFIICARVMLYMNIENPNPFKD